MSEENRTSEILHNIKSFAENLTELNMDNFRENSEEIKTLNAWIEKFETYRKHIKQKSKPGVIGDIYYNESIKKEYKEYIETILKFIEDVLKSKIKLIRSTVASMRNVADLLLEIIAKDYLQEFDVKQIFAMLWDACINTIDEPNDDYGAIEQKVNLVLYSLKVFIDDLNKYHKTETKGVAAELVKYIWNQCKNFWYNKNFPVRNQNVAERIFFLLLETLKYGDIANFANENLADILSLATDVLNLNFWLNFESNNKKKYCAIPGVTGSHSENSLVVFHTLEALLELSQMGGEQSKQVNDKIEKFGLKIEDDTIVIADKNMFDGFYGDKSECISKTINGANRGHIKNKRQRDNKEKANYETNENKIENETEDPKVGNNNDQKNTNKTQSNDLQTKIKPECFTIEKKGTENEEQEQEENKDTKKVIKTDTQNKTMDNGATFTNEQMQILEEIENAYINNRDIGNGINPKQLSEAIKSSKKYYHYAAMLSSEKYGKTKKYFSLCKRLVIFLYSSIFFKFYDPQKNDAYKQPILNKDTDKIFPQHQNIIEQTTARDTNTTNDKTFDSSL